MPSIGSTTTLGRRAPRTVAARFTLSWFGCRTLKSPLDLWTYQEILVETRPDLVVECGTRFGGAAYYIATLLDLIGHGQVVTVDIEALKGRPVHRRISYLVGSSTDPAIVAQVRGTAAGKRVMVILDSDHSAAHVAGSWLIVEDTNVNGNPCDRTLARGRWRP